MQRFGLSLVTAVGVLLATRSAPAQTIDASQHHTCVSTKSGQLYCWGRVGWWPIQIPALPPDSVVLSPATIGPRHSTRARYRSITTGWLHDCALRRDGVIVCNGNNGNGELGRGGIFDAPPPRLATALRFESVTAGLHHTCALTAEGKAYCWGVNFAGQVGNGTRVQMVTRPTPVVGGHHFRLLTAGGEHTCGITTRGRTLCWGANTRGQLGRDPALTGCKPDKACMAVPRPPDDRHRFRTLSAGASHTCGVTIVDELFCWGDQYSDYQQVGRTPRAIGMTLIATPAPIRSMSSGQWSTCGLTDDGRAFCWGAGVGRRLVRSQCQGAATCLDSVPVSRTIRFRALAVGDRHACGIGRSGNVYCWGIRDVRKIGNAQSPADHPPPCSPTLVNADVRCAVEPFQVLVPNVYTGELLSTLAPTVVVGQGPSSADSLVLERTRCFGTCPAYRLRISRDGGVDYQSRNPGDPTRAREAVVPQTLDELVGAADRAGFFGLPARIASDRELCAVSATDHPTVTITVYGATTRAVEYYTGCYIQPTDSTSGKPGPGIVRHSRLVHLGAFANAIDSALGSARWVRPAALR